MTNLSYSDMYELLSAIPLFRGVGGDDLGLILDRANLRRVTVERGEPIVMQGDACRNLIVVLSGRVRVVTHSVRNDYSLVEWIDEVHTIELEQLYGLQQRYARTYEADTEVVCLVVSKDDVRRTLMGINIWRINLLNALSTAQARYRDMAIEALGDSLEEQIYHFVRLRALTQYGPKQLTITMATLGRYTNSSRVVVSNALHRLREKGRIEMKAGEIGFASLDAFQPQSST